MCPPRHGDTATRRHGTGSCRANASCGALGNSAYSWHQRQTMVQIVQAFQVDATEAGILALPPRFRQQHWARQQKWRTVTPQISMAQHGSNFLENVYLIIWKGPIGYYSSARCVERYGCLDFEEQLITLYWPTRSAFHRFRWTQVQLFQNPELWVNSRREQ